MTAPATPYRVLARKYRPADFSTLIGQDALVRTLSNALATGRIAQAFMLTGVRGVGKTTTARIIARALNCTGTDGTGGPTISPCGICPNCTAIAEDRHPDVIEMDAASRTGVDGIRDLIDGVRYAPVQARMKVYILDEVHMLSTAAFNALLKTLEEPPPHVKFVFCTTEIGKVPVTVLSRCQRFDLKRVEARVLIDHFTRVAGEEGATVEDGAMALIARAAEGSVRDGLSLLDQAIAHTNGQVTAAQVRDMLGLADRARIVDLFELALRGDAPGALANLAGQYADGADPEAVLRNLLEFTHFVTRIRLVPAAANDVSATPVERERGQAFAARLGVPTLTRTWQLLLKGLGEVRTAPQPYPAAEMVLIRLCYAADLPNPADLVQQLSDGGAVPATAPSRVPSGPRGGGSSALAAVPRPVDAPPVMAVAPQAQAATAAIAIPDVRALLDLCSRHRAAILRTHIYEYLRPIRFEQGSITCAFEPGAPDRLAQDIATRLREWTGERWVVALQGMAGSEPSLKAQDQAAKAATMARAEADPGVQALLAAFPGAVIEQVSDLPVAVPPPDEMKDDDE